MTREQNNAARVELERAESALQTLRARLLSAQQSGAKLYDVERHLDSLSAEICLEFRALERAALGLSSTQEAVTA